MADAAEVRKDALALGINDRANIAKQLPEKLDGLDPPLYRISGDDAVLTTDRQSLIALYHDRGIEPEPAEFRCGHRGDCEAGCPATVRTMLATPAERFDGSATLIWSSPVNWLCGPA